MRYLRSSLALPSDAVCVAASPVDITDDEDDGGPVSKGIGRQSIAVRVARRLRRASDARGGSGVEAWRKLFFTADADGSGTISCGELLSLVTDTVGMELSAMETLSLLSALDTDGSGDISLQVVSCFAMHSALNQFL